MSRGTRMTVGDMIEEILSYTRIHPVLLDFLARYEFRSSFRKSTNYRNMISSLNDEAIATIYETFVEDKRLPTRPGKAQEWKLANYMLQNPPDDIPDTKELQMKIDAPLPSKAGGRTNKIDVILQDSNDIVLAIGEAKDTSKPVSKDDIAKWFNIIDEYLKSPDFLDLKACYYLSRNDYKDDAMKTIKDRVQGFDDYGWGKYSMKTGLISKNKVWLVFLEEREGQINSAF